jgi:hypothetical protein
MRERPKDGEHRAGVPEPVSDHPIEAGDGEREGLEGIDALEQWFNDPATDGDDG